MRRATAIWPLRVKQRNPRGTPLRRALRRRCMAIGLLLATACGAGHPDVEEIRELQVGGNFEATVEPLRNLLEQEPSNAELHFLYGVALAQTGNVSLALFSLHEASQDETWFVPASLELARAALAAHDPRVAIESASGVLERDPNHVYALSLRGQARLEDRIDTDGALEDLSRILELAPDDIPARLTHFAALLAAERVEDAEVALAEVERRAADGALVEDDMARICSVRASFAHERGELERAALLYEGCLDEYPTSTAVLDLAVEFFDARGRPERGTEILSAFSKRVPESTLHRGRLAYRLRSAGDPEAAERLLVEAAQSENPALRAHAWSALTDHYIATADLAAAVHAFESSMEYEGQLSSKRRLAYADLLAGAGMHERALSVAADLGESALGDLIRARVALDQGRPCEALDAYEGAFPFWPNNAVARYYAARAAEQCGRFDKAFEHYRQSMRSGRSSDAGLRLARLMWAEGRPERAIFGVQHQLESNSRDPEMVLLKTRIALRLQEGSMLQSILVSLPASRLRARVMVVVAEHAAANQGPEVAIRGLRADRRLELTRPRDAPALGLLLELLLAVGRPEQAHAILAAALSGHPEAADLHYERARLLEREGAQPGEGTAAFERAVALDPTHAGALLALGRQAAARGEIDEAVALFDRAAAADPAAGTPAREAAQLLFAVGQTEAAAERLDALLREFPYDGAAALTRATLGLARVGPSDRNYELARRALHFGGGPAAAQLLSRIESQRAARPQGGWAAAH